MKKFCTKCGKELEEGMRFCPECGAGVEEMDKGIVGEQNEIKEKMSVSQNATGKKISDIIKRIPALKNRKFVFGISAGIIIIIAITIFAVTRPKTIDLNAYLNEPEYSGLDGEGEVYFSFNNDLETDLENALKESGKLPSADWDDESSWDALDIAIDAYDLILDPAQIVISQDTGLSNGDKITVSYKYDEDAFKEYGIRLKGNDKEFTVEGLQEAIVIDAFSSNVFNVSDDSKGIHIDFTGVSPNAKVNIRKDLPSDNQLSMVDYEADDVDGVEKGDKVTITASLPDDMIDDGYKLKEESTTVICDNVSEYITSLDDIDEETWDKIKSQCDDIKKSVIDQNDWWVTLDGNDNEQIGKTSNYKYTKAYLLSVKPGLEDESELDDGWGMDDEWDLDNNVLKIEFQIDCGELWSFGDSTEESYTGLTGVYSISNIVKNTSGEIELNVTDIRLVDYGYENEDSMILEEIDANADNYTHTEKELDWSK